MKVFLGFFHASYVGLLPTTAAAAAAATAVAGGQRIIAGSTVTHSPGAILSSQLTGRGKEKEGEE